MAKIYGLFGSMTGKVADVVMVTRNGEQIVRKYQPTVSNPQTANQVAARARLKLMSQLSAVMNDVIAMPRVGVVSTRNLFVKTNYRASSYTDGVADITLTDVQLTRSVVGLPALEVSRNVTTLNLALANATVGLSRVVYAVFLKQADGKLRYAGSAVASTPGAGNTFETTLEGITQLPAVIYAYGVRDNTEAAKASFGNLTVLSAETVAKLLVSRVLTEADITLTETSAIELAAQ